MAERRLVMSDFIIGDDGDREKLCAHGIGHGYGVHTCDGCCSEPGFFNDLDNEGTIDHPDVTTEGTM
jgi:hypothetical protein